MVWQVWDFLDGFGVIVFVNIHKPPPTRCDDCKSLNIKYEADIDSNRLWPYVWRCLDCKAKVGCHPGTDHPLGYMANPYVRRLRAELHDLIDPIWEYKLATRSEIYNWLARELGLEGVAHISQLPIHQLKLAIKIVSGYVDKHRDIIEKAKRNDRSNKGNRGNVKSGRRVHENSIRSNHRSRPGRYRRTD
jgi:hypothetical protein